MFQKVIQYDSSVNDWGSQILATNDGGYVLIGNDGNLNNGGVCLIKLNGQGDTLWTKVYSDIGGDYGGEYILQCSNGGYFIYGFTYYDYTDIFMIRTDANGDSLWTKLFVDPGWSGAEFMKECNDGGFLITGEKGYSSNANSPSNALIIKIDSLGDTLWTKTYGGINDNWINNFIETSNGGYILAGGTNSFGAGGYDIWLIKIDSLGNLIWNKTYGEAGDETGTIITAPNGGFIVMGYTSSFGAGHYEVFLMKIDSIGNIIWDKTYSILNDDERVVNILSCADEGYILVGASGIYTSSIIKSMLIKTDSFGNIKWSNIYYYFSGDGNDFSQSVIQTSDKGFMFTGDVNIDTINGGTGIYLVKTDSLGNSGCNQNSITLTVGTPNWVVTTPVPSIGYDSMGIQSVNTTIISGGLSINTICYTDGIDEIKNRDNEIIVYPDPANSVITFLQSNISTNQQLLITDLTGREILLQPINNSTQSTIDISQWSDGIYFYVLKGRNEIKRGKFIVQK